MEMSTHLRASVYTSVCMFVCVLVESCGGMMQQHGSHILLHLIAVSMLANTVRVEVQEEHMCFHFLYKITLMTLYALFKARSLGSIISCFGMTVPCGKSKLHKEMFFVWKNLTDLQPDPTPVGVGETAWGKIPADRQQRMNANGLRIRCLIKDGYKVKNDPSEKE